MNVALAKTESGRALSDAFTVARDRLPGVGKVGELRRQAFENYDSVGLRTVASRTGNTPICAF